MMCSGPCRACCGQDFKEFERPRREKLAGLLRQIVGEGSIDKLSRRTVREIRTSLLATHDRLGGNSLAKSVEMLGEFIFSLKTCGLSALADAKVVRVLILINQGMQHIGLPMGLLPLQFFYLMSPDPAALATKQMLRKVLRSFADHLIAEETSRRRGKGLQPYEPSRIASAPLLGQGGGLPKKRRVGFCGFDLGRSAPTPGLVGRSLQDWDDEKYECWLVVRSEKKKGKGTKWKGCCHPSGKDFDLRFRPAAELWRKFRGRILCIYADVSDDECANEIYKLGLHVCFHINGYNYQNFYAALLQIMDRPQAPVLIEMVSMASPLQSSSLAHFTISSPCLLDKDHLAEPPALQQGAYRQSNERFVLTDLVYPVEGDQLDRQLSLGPPSEADGQPALVYSGGIARLTLEMQRLVVNVLHAAPPGMLFWVQADPEGKFMEIIETARAHCAANGWPDHSSQIVRYPFNNSKDRHIDVLSRRRDSGCPPAMARARLIGIGSSPCNQHTGAGDGMIACIPTVGLVGEAWSGRVVAGMNWFVGTDELLNASSMQELESRILHLICNPWLINALSQHMWVELKAQRSFYNKERIRLCMQKAAYLCLEQVRESRGDRGKLRNIDLTDSRSRSPKFVPPPGPVPSFSCTEDVARLVAAQLAGMMGLTDSRRSGDQRERLLARLAAGLKRHRRFLTYDRVGGKGATRVTLVGRVRMKALSARVAEKYGLKEGSEIALKIEFLAWCSSVLKTLANSCNIHEAQALDTIEKRLARKDKCLERFTRLLPLWENGNAAVSLVLCTGGAICFMLCQAVTGDLRGSETLWNAREAWRSNGEVSEALHAIARGSLHAFHLLHQEAGFALMDPSHSNVHLFPCNTAGLDPDIRARMPPMCGFLDLGSAVDIGTSRQRMSGDARVRRAPADETFTLPEAEAQGLARGLVLLSSRHLEEHSGHVQLMQEGLGKTPGGTRGFRDESLMNSPLTADLCVRIDSFGCVAMIYQIFCPRSRTMGCDAYAAEMKAAAESPEAMLCTMKSYTTAQIQQPQAAKEFANLLWCMMRGKDRLGLLDGLLHPAISLPVLTPYQSRALEAGIPLPFPGGRGPMGSPWEQEDVPGWDRRLDGDRGPGLFAQKRLEYGQLAGLYIGVDCGAAEFPPGRSNVSLTHNPDGQSPGSCAIGELPLSVLEEKRGAGVFFNAGDTRPENNLRLDRRKVWRDGKGLAYMPLFVSALHGIEPGGVGLWHYDPFAGIGGAESYTFNDAKYGMGGMGNIKSRRLQE